MTKDKNPTWNEVIGPIINQMELAAKLDMTYQLNATGAKAVASLMKQMCDIIDNEINRRNKLNRL